MSEDRKIFSLNMVAWLKLKGLESISKGRDEATGNVYWVFPECGKLIREYKQNEWLHSFLEQFKELKKEVRELSN